MEMNFPFERKFVEPCRRLEQTFACSPSRGFDGDAYFNMDNRRRFLEEIQEKEVEVNAVTVAMRLVDWRFSCLLSSSVVRQLGDICKNIRSYVIYGHLGLYGKMY